MSSFSDRNLQNKMRNAQREKIKINTHIHSAGSEEEEQEQPIDAVQSEGVNKLRFVSETNLKILNAPADEIPFAWKHPMEPSDLDKKNKVLEDILSKSIMKID